MTTSTTTSNNVNVAGQNRQETADELTAFLNAQDAATATKTIVTEVKATTEEKPMNTTATTSSKASVPHKTLTPKDIAFYPGEVSCFLEDDAPTIYTVGNINLLKADNKINIVASEETDNKTWKSIYSVVEYLSQKEPVYVLANAKVTDLDGKDADGREQAGLAEVILKNTNSSMILVMAKGFGDAPKAFAEYIQSGRLLILTIVNPKSIIQDGTLEIAKYRLCIAKCLTNAMIVMYCATRAGTWNAVTTALAYGTKVYVFDLKRNPAHRDLITFWRATRLNELSQLDEIFTA